MATIEKRTTAEGISYRVKVRLRGYPVQSATFSRLTDARKWAQQTEAAIREGRHFKTAEAKRHTLGDAIDRYSREVLPTKRSAKDTLRQLSWWKERIGEYRLADITPALIVEARSDLLIGVTYRNTQRSPSTTNRYIAALRHVLSIAVREWGWLEVNPFYRIANLKEPRGRVRFLSDDERRRLLTECKAHSNTLYTIVVLALSTGARKQEIMRLTWRDIDLYRGLIQLEETKNGERRALALQGHACELVKDMAKVRRLDTELLFPSRRDPKQPLALQNIFEAAIERAGIQDFRFHDLRHSAASYLAMNGATLAEIAEVLGHKTLQMVKRYSHLSDSHIAGVVARMNERIFRD